MTLLIACCVDPGEDGNCIWTTWVGFGEGRGGGGVLSPRLLASASASAVALQRSTHCSSSLRRWCSTQESSAALGKWAPSTHSMHTSKPKGLVSPPMKGSPISRLFWHKGTSLRFPSYNLSGMSKRPPTNGHESPKLSPSLHSPKHHP